MPSALPTCLPDGSATKRFRPSSIEPFLFFTETRNGFVVCTLSDHCWHSVAQTVGSGAFTAGSGVGVANRPWNARTGCLGDSACPPATAVGAEPLAAPARDGTTPAASVRTADAVSGMRRQRFMPDLFGAGPRVPAGL